MLSRRALLVGGGTGMLCRGAAAASVSERRSFPGQVGVAVSRSSDSVEAVACSLRRALLHAVPQAETGAAAVARLFSSHDVVGIKLNCLAGPQLSPRPILLEALAAVLAEGGVPRSQIIAFERSSAELERAGFTLRRRGGDHLCYGIDNDYEREPSESGQIGSCFARLVSTTCTALISLGVVKDHDLAGVSAGMKNWYGVIHNPNKYHDKNCDPYVADVVRHPWIRDKLRLTLLDGASAQCQGGPAFFPGGIFPLDRVVASTDQVAADLWAWQAIEKERAKRGMPSLSAERRAPRFLQTAAGHGLGVAESQRLKVVGP